MTEPADPAGLQRLLDGIDYVDRLADGRAEVSALLLDLLTVRDSFDRLFRDETDAGDTARVGSCRLIARQLDAVLRRAGVEAAEAVGIAADPERHEVVGVRAVDPGQEGVVVEVVRRGYDRDGQPFRVAQVVIGGSDQEATR